MKSDLLSSPSMTAKQTISVGANFSVAPVFDNLLISSFKGGGVLFVQADAQDANGAMHYMDRLDTTGIWMDENRLVRVLRHPDALLLISYSASKAADVVVHTDFKLPHDVHIFSDEIYVVSTGTNEIVRLGKDGAIADKKVFPGGQDAWHLNCLATWNGRLVVSGFGKFDSPHGWRNNDYAASKGTGFVMDVSSEEILWGGLTHPHTPRIDEQGNLYVCESANQRLLIQEPNGFQREISFPGRFVRGLAWGKDHLYVGLSVARSGPPLPDGEHGGAIAILNRQTLELEGQFAIPVTSIYDVIVVEPDWPNFLM